MGIEDGTCEFALTRPLEYSRNGTTEKALHVVLREPGMDHVAHYLRLKQIITQAQFAVAKIAGDINRMRDSIPVNVNIDIGEEVKPITENASDIEKESDQLADSMSMMLQAVEVDIREFISIFETMACMKARKPIVLVDGVQAMTTALWAGLKPDDAYNMAVRWCTFFAMPSEMGGQTISGQQSGSPTGRTAA